MFILTYRDIGTRPSAVSDKNNVHCVSRMRRRKLILKSGTLINEQTKHYLSILLFLDRPTRCLIELAHHKQKHSWDCGISCVLMILEQELREQLAQNINRVCKDDGLNKSVWTIDLCYLLARFGIQHIFYTITLGVHPGYKTNAFYKRVLNKDEKRVNDRFARATEHGIKIKRKSVDVSALLEHLIYGPVIVLTNARLLNCERCQVKKVIACDLRRCLPWPQPYQGHYVVLCGYDVQTRRLFYRNPSLSDRKCFVFSCD